MNPMIQLPPGSDDTATSTDLATSPGTLRIEVSFAPDPACAHDLIIRALMTAFLVAVRVIAQTVPGWDRSRRGETHIIYTDLPLPQASRLASDVQRAIEANPMVPRAIVVTTQIFTTVCAATDTGASE